MFTHGVMAHMYGRLRDVPPKASPIEPANGAEINLGAMAPTQTDFDLTGLNSHLDSPTQQDLSDDGHSEVPVPLSPHPFDTSFGYPASYSSSSVHPNSSSPQVNALIYP